MRMISLAVLVDASVQIGDVVSKIESNFPEYLPEYDVVQQPDSGCAAIYWRKIVIGDNMRTGEIVDKIGKDVSHSGIILEEWGADPGFAKKYMVTVLGYALLAASVLYHFVIG